MRPIAFPEANRKLNPPAGMKNCEPLHVRVENGIVLSVWQITPKELAELIVGRVICVQVWSGETSPPISLHIPNAPDPRNEKGEGA